MTNLPEPLPTKSNLPERRLSNRDFELVIRRAAELQARDAEVSGGEGITEAEAIRIGKELGLSTQNLSQALAETGAGSNPESGLMVRLFGQQTVRAGRAIPGDAVKVAQILERYLVECEFLAVLRRFPDRVLFTRATGFAATMGRATSQIFGRTRLPPLRVENLEMAVHPFDEGSIYVSLATSLSGQRNAAVASSVIGGGTGTALTGAVIGIAIAPPAALIALPIIGLSVLAGRQYYGNVVEKVQVQLESLLDRLEHGELPPPVRAWTA